MILFLSSVFQQDKKNNQEKYDKLTIVIIYIHCIYQCNYGQPVC